MTNTTDIKNELESILEDLIFDTDNSYGWPPDFEPNFPKAVAAIQALIDRATQEAFKRGYAKGGVDEILRHQEAAEAVSKGNPQGFVTQIEATLSNTTGEGK